MSSARDNRLSGSSAGYGSVQQSDSTKKRNINLALGVLDPNAVKTILADHAIHVSELASDKVAELVQFAEDGHWSWKILGLIASGAMVVVGTLGLLWGFFGGSLYASLVYIFVVFFGIVGVILEMKKSLLNAMQLQTLREEAHFLFLPTGRSVFYVFTGLFLLTQSGCLVFLDGLFAIFVGATIYLSSRNAIAALAALRYAASNEEALRKKFIEFDEDGSGTLSTAELAQLCANLGSNLSHNELEAALFVLDANGDGQVSFEEFLQWWQRKPSGW